MARFCTGIPFLTTAEEKSIEKNILLFQLEKDDELIARIAEHWGTSDHSCQFLVESYESLNMTPPALFLDGPSDLRSYKAEWLLEYLVNRKRGVDYARRIGHAGGARRYDILGERF